MKKILVLCLIIAVGLGASGATCMQQVQDTVCSPPAAVMAVVSAAAPLVAFMIQQAVPGSVVFVNAVSIQQTITAILAGTCVSVEQLNKLIAWIQSEQIQSLQAKANLKKGPMKATALSARPLIAWRDNR
jgi:hypothetical protein